MQGRERHAYDPGVRSADVLLDRGVRAGRRSGAGPVCRRPRVAARSGERGRALQPRPAAGRVHRECRGEGGPGAERDALSSADRDRWLDRQQRDVPRARDAGPGGGPEGGGRGGGRPPGAAAGARADGGRRVLLASTDPASNLDEVRGAPLGPRPTAVPGVPGLAAMNLDPEAAARDYRERVVGPYREALPAAAVASIEEQLSGACTVEIAAFDEFSKLLGDPATTRAYDPVVFAPGPTGHTLRLLTLPAAWAGFLDTNGTGASCLGPLAALADQRALYERTLAALTD